MPGGARGYVAQQDRTQQLPMSHGPRPIYVPSDILIHPAIWPQ